MRISSVLLAGLWITATLLGVPARAVELPGLIREAIRLPCEAKTIPSLRARAERLPSAQFKSSWVQYSLN